MKSKSIRLAVVIFITAAGHAYAQLTNHAAAAAGATIGTAGGKVLSNVLDKALAPAAQPDDARSRDGVPANKLRGAPTSPVRPSSTPAATADVSSPAGSGSGPAPLRKSRRAAAGNSYYSTADRMASYRGYEQAAPPPSLQDFAKIKDGSSRQDVLTALGIPSSRITIPDEGHLIEIMSYQDSTHRIGSIRLDNGLVVGVTTASR